ncbi:MAG: rhodanese family protein [Pseudomonadota bacterium]
MSTQSLTHVDAKTLKQWLDDDRAVLIDIREADEHAREHIPGARLVPLSSFNASDFASEQGKVGVFHCQSGARTEEATARILRAGFDEVYHLQGGLTGWKAAGLPVNLNRSAPISIMRQVQITAGLMVVLGIVLALLVSPWFMGLSAFVGAGLTFAGATGTCALASVLRLMPWNKPAGASSGGAPVMGQI